MNYYKLLTLVFVLTVFLGGCATSAVIKDVELKPTLTIPANQKSKPIQFKKVVAKIERGTHIGAVQGGLLCLSSANLTWQGGRVTVSTDELTDIVRAELEKCNFQVVGDPNALFEDPSEWKAELLLAGLITNLQMNICYPYNGFGNWVSAKGEAYMKVNWQIYSRLDRKVIYEVTTEGNYKSSETLADSGIIIWHNSFAMAARNLLSDKGFYDLVVGSTKTVSEPLFDKISIAKVTSFSNPFSENVNDVRLGVATVFAGDGHGSGFFISKNGFLLTNQHVVGGAQFVKVKLATGREILGEVLRCDTKRDVALVKVEESQMSALPICSTDINVGDDVYAIGSPLDEQFQSTISKGIISNYRVMDENKYIQSDVNVLQGCSGGPLLDNKGNVVGIAVSGIAIGGTTTGLNFFVPIKEALNILRIEQKEQ